VSAEAWSAAGWFGLALLVRAPLVARIEGALDHDQSVVGLMALDIAAGRRFPIFFDGQRYMGAVEAYAAAAFVRALGHAPEVIALAPLVAFGLFTAGQYVVWARWRGRAAGHLAAGLTVLGSPMLVLWGIIPRGGYVEFLAWALPTLAAYRAFARPGRPEPSKAGQAAWGFLLALGYFLNPLSLTVYATIALDWTLGRHGADLRRERGLRWTWLDGPAAPVVGLVAAAVWVTAMAFCCHVDPRGTADGSPYVALGGFVRGRWGLAVGGAGVVALLAAAAWWTRGPSRLFERLKVCHWVMVGALAAWSPFLAYAVSARLGAGEAAPSLPVWITAPWKAGPNVRTAARALGPLVGCDPRAMGTVLIGQGVDPPWPRWPAFESGLANVSPLVVAVALGLLAAAVARERSFWSSRFALKGDDVAPPVPLAAGFLAVSVGLYLLQGTSPNASSVRYLVPVWVALPGLIACGLLALPRRAATVAGLVLVVPWASAQALVWSDLDRSAPARPLAAELARRGVTAVVAPTPVALIVANLTHGNVGAVEYQPIWPRLGGRYLARFPAGRPLTCVVDRRFPWAIDGEGAWAPGQDFGRHLRGLSARHPGRARTAWEVGSFEVWEVDLPLAEVLAPEPDGTAPGRDLAAAE
jgi:hypothetical protein